MPPALRPADKNDYKNLFSLINSLAHLHRHLDWRDPLEWMERKPFWVLEENNQIIATLACAPEPEEVAWVRLFAATMHSSPDYAWRKLIEPVLDDLRALPYHPALVSLAMHDWYEEMLLRNGFIHHQDIVVFLYDDAPPPAPALDSAYYIRTLAPGELEAVAVIDHMAFEPIWRLSLDDLRHAVTKSAYCTVVECAGQIVAYQMSSRSSVYAHLARLAVRPDLQGQRLGFALVQDLLTHFIGQHGQWGVTLNTQNNNQSSLNLYHKIGFRETGERFPVFLYPY